MYSISVIVSINAIGSLLPLSSSRVGRRFCDKFNPFERKIENTEAESVEDITLASRSACAKVSLSPNQSEIAYMKIPVNIAVNNTPKVASTTPSFQTGFMSE